ncbi:type II secretion system protein GspM [Duganella aceris]|uniref:Type II secretion system protein M n=1 Tax=Duganella aceris TaxID=2703883 RepID=A0ABX0FJF1_9BURK|nr:type II secretion system protein M [Duganella aceris]NGZ84604.1 type II secretion system protein M [Duganella aceris]
MKQYWIKLDQWAMALSLRERLMAFGAAGAVLVFLAYQLVLEPGWAKQRAMRDMMQQQRAQVAAIEGELAQLDAASSLDPDKELRQRLLRLQEDSAALRVSLRTAQKGMVAPEKMSPLLQQMVQGHGKLRLVSLKTMPPQGMVDGQFPASAGDEPAATPTPAVAATVPTPLAAVLAAPAPAAAGATPALAPAAPPQPSLLFRHGVQLVLEGSYPDMVNYLQALEHMPTRLFWGGAALDAQKYPQARLTLTLYTLSLDQKWIAL